MKESPASPKLKEVIVFQLLFLVGILSKHLLKKLKAFQKPQESKKFFHFLAWALCLVLITYNEKTPCFAHIRPRMINKFLLHTLDNSGITDASQMILSLTSLYQNHVAMGHITWDAAQAALLPHLEKSISTYKSFGTAPKVWFLNPPAPRGLYLWGDVGRGKTFLMDMIIAAMTPMPIYKEHTHLWLKMLHQNPRSDSEMRLWAKDFSRKWGILCLDEMEINHISDGMLLQRALAYLWDAGVILLTTSNVPPENLYPKGLNRELLVPFFERFACQQEIFALQGAHDYRKSYRDEALTSQRDLYLTPATRETTAKLFQWWHAYTEGAPPQPRFLSFAGRSLTLLRTGSKACWLTFGEACRAPLGLLDYEAIIATFPLLIISDIPLLTSQDGDATRRFMVFVDLLYEKRRVTLFSADAPPQDLLKEGALKKPFARTISRLQQMRFWDIP